jgi:T5SS/PEP-CTERM-associated repeat protein
MVRRTPMSTGVLRFARSLIIFAAAYLAFSSAATRAAITATGGVDPLDPKSWTSDTSVRIGSTLSGTLTVNGGSNLVSGGSYVACGSGVRGVVNIFGTGSTWTSSYLCVGVGGSGTLSIANGGNVTNMSYCTIGNDSGSVGLISVDGTGSTWVNKSGDTTGIIVGSCGNGTLSIANGGSVSVDGDTVLGASTGNGMIRFTNGGTLTTRSLSASLSQLSGKGTIVTGGFVSDTDVRFDSSHGLIQTLTFPGQNVTVNLDMTPRPAGVYEGDIGAGWRGAGSLTIQDGLVVPSYSGILGGCAGSTGVGLVSGTGSTWHYYDLAVGRGGNGSLTIANGGSVTGAYGRIGFFSGSMGQLTVAGTGSTWASLNASIGDSGNGALSVNNGGQVSSGTVYMGGQSGSMGVAAVDGVGSTWVASSFYAGYRGSGTLSVENGGTVRVSVGQIGDYAGSSGAVAVEGTGSSFTINRSLYVGGEGTGTLSVVGGGTVTAHDLSVSSTSLLAVDVGRASLLSTGTGGGTISNNGTIRIFAGAGVPTSGYEYSPIFVGTWGGTGTYQAIGGTWSTTNHRFTASSVMSGTSGSGVALNLACVQRALVTDSGLGKANSQVGASFVTAGSTTNIVFTATAMDTLLLDNLQGQLPTGKFVLDGWSFSTTNYAVSSTNPIYLSFKVGPGQSSDDLAVWQYSGNSWKSYTPLDMTYDGIFASFTATSLDRYAMVGVPEPTTLALSVVSAIGLLAYAWRRKKLHHLRLMILAAMVVLATSSVQADVFNMGGTRNPMAGTWTGLASLEFVTVGDPGNATDTRNPYIPVGKVDYIYSIGRCEVTAGQYCAFLNAVAATDTYRLYNTWMANGTATNFGNIGCGIVRNGNSGSYVYSVISGCENRPVDLVSWGDAARFCNWLQNGQPVGSEGAGTTETGAYTLNGDTSSLLESRNTGAKYFIPSDDEWHKAAYYDPNKPGGAGYWDYATKSDTAPTNVLSATGTNNANYRDNHGTGNGGFTIGSPNWLTDVDAFAGSLSPYGTLDQAGNVTEWTERITSSMGYRYRLLRGAGFSDDDLLHANTDSLTESSHESFGIGFRIASSIVPEPSTLALLSIVATTLLAYAWRQRG